jgi:hypothetical protein
MIKIHSRDFIRFYLDGINKAALGILGLVLSGGNLKDWFHSRKPWEEKKDFFLVPTRLRGNQSLRFLQNF